MNRVHNRPPGRVAFFAEQNLWHQYFRRSFQQKILSWYRRRVIAPAVRYHTDRLFPADGILLEAGAGTSESSCLIRRGHRRMALDWNRQVLTAPDSFPWKIVADIRALPFRPATVDGLWNLGVMEHFSAADLVDILREFSRVLKPGANLLFFWAPRITWYSLQIWIMEWLTGHIGINLRLTPPQLNPYRNRATVNSWLAAAGLQLRDTIFSWRDGFTYVLVVATNRVER